MLRESRLNVHDLILPIFVCEGTQQKIAISSMPDVYRYSIDLLVEQAQKAKELGIPAIAIFPVVGDNLKSADAKEAYNPNNLICRAIKAVKAKVSDLGIIADVALDPYSSHGHDGLLKNDYVDNDLTVEILCKQAVEQAKAGCDIIAPSDMMDGRVGAIRKALDAAGFINIKILSYAAKYASNFYGPFRDAVGSATNLGKSGKETYQMDFANSDEALAEVAMDIDEGADMVMVKPGMPYLDIVRRVKDEFNVHVFAYQVSGEYAMLKFAAEQNCFDYERAMYEALLGFKRAGATGIFTYAALEMAEFLSANG
jgi:porphobilinogen synthase